MQHVIIAKAKPFNLRYTSNTISNPENIKLKTFKDFPEVKKKLENESDRIQRILPCRKDIDIESFYIEG